MADRVGGRSRFGIEVLLSPRYLRDALLAQVEAGLLPLELAVRGRRSALDVRMTMHPPVDRELHYPDADRGRPAPVEGSFELALLCDDPDGADLELDVVTDLRDEAGGWAGRLRIGLLFAIGLAADVDSAGFESDHRLYLSLVALDPMTQLALSTVGLPVDELTARLKTRLDRTVPLDLARGQQVHGTALRIVPGDRGRPAALVVEVGLAPCATPPVAGLLGPGSRILAAEGTSDLIASARGCRPAAG
jgi:hypothetical protein